MNPIPQAADPPSPNVHTAGAHDQLTSSSQLHRAVSRVRRALQKRCRGVISHVAL